MKVLLLSYSLAAVIARIVENLPPPCGIGECVIKPWCDGFTVCEKCQRIERVAEPPIKF